MAYPSPHSPPSPNPPPAACFSRLQPEHYCVVAEINSKLAAKLGRPAQRLPAILNRRWASTRRRLRLRFGIWQSAFGILFPLAALLGGRTSPPFCLLTRRLCHGARQNQPGRGASKPANVLTYSIPHPFYPTQLFLELLVPVHAVWPADTPTSEDNGGSVTVSSGGEHPSSPAVLRRPFGFVFSGVPDWPAVSEVEWPPCRRR